MFSHIIINYLVLLLIIFPIQLHFSVQFLFFLAENLVILFTNPTIYLFTIYTFFLLKIPLFFILAALSQISNSAAYLNLTMNTGYVSCPFLFLYPMPKPFFLLFYALEHTIFILSLADYASQGIFLLL